MLKFSLAVLVCLAAPAVAMAQTSDPASGADLAKKLARSC